MSSLSKSDVEETCFPQKTFRGEADRVLVNPDKVGSSPHEAVVVWKRLRSDMSFLTNSFFEKRRHERRPKSLSMNCQPNTISSPLLLKRIDKWLLTLLVEIQNPEFNFTLASMQQKPGVESLKYVVNQLNGSKYRHSGGARWYSQKVMNCQGRTEAKPVTRTQLRAKCMFKALDDSSVLAIRWLSLDLVLAVGTCKVTLGRPLWVFLNGEDLIDR